MRKELSFWLLVLVLVSGAMSLGYALAHAEGIDCGAAKTEQVAKGNGHAEHCFDLSGMDTGIQLNPIRSSPNLEITSLFGTEEMGYYRIEENGQIDYSKWKSSIMGVMA